MVGDRKSILVIGWFFLVGVVGLNHPLPALAIDSYYTIDESETPPPYQNHFPIWYYNPPDANQPSGTFFERRIANIHLVRWIGHEEPLEPPQEPYSRKRHYGGWIKGNSASNCYNTRARVLMRESRGPVSFSSSNPCIVETGKWYDPYVGRWVYWARDLEIDHVVPVKSSYELGGYRWSRGKRCVFFNFLEAKEHLIPISPLENTKKSAKGPEGYLPPNKAYVCTYLKNWLFVKLVWSLPILPEEGHAIHLAIQRYQCATQHFLVNAEEILRLRKKIVDQFHSCYQDYHQQPTVD
ncbi:MAG: hypothetical protein NZ480_03365 [Bdellovibrionaceae bacterium]|nr:hypothetical protein [Pseudobdellovibrionaceae bacterium]MDW8190155.1 hypothetical protein [Pseudobdellovibrionaceae bacterium]